MINLKVEAYCNNCPEFDPWRTATLYGDEDAVEVVVQCEHAAKCRAIKNYLEKEEGRHEKMQGLPVL